MTSTCYAAAGAVAVALYTIRSGRQLIDHNELFRWFVGFSAGRCSLGSLTFTKNRDRLLGMRRRAASSCWSWSGNWQVSCRRSTSASLRR